MPPPALVKGELVDGVIEFLPEKKQPSNARVMAMDKVTWRKFIFEKDTKKILLEKSNPANLKKV